MRRRTLRRSFIALAATALSLAPFVGAELYLRWKGTNPAPPALSEAYERFLLRAARPLYRARWTLEGVVFEGRWEHRRGSAASFPERPRRGVTRLVVLGESSAELLGDNLYALSSARPAGDLEVVNCALGAVSLEQTERRLREAFRYRPDVVLCLFGHNLRYRHPNEVWPAWRRRLPRLRLLDWLAHRRSHPPQADRPERRLEELRRFFDELALHARRRGARLVLCTVPSNLRYPPAFDPAAAADPRYLEAVAAYRRGRRQEGIRRLEPLAAESSVALWHFRLGEWMLRQGRPTEARRHLLTARDLDPAGTRAASGVNEVIREAAARHGAALLDLERLVADAAEDGIPGWREFDDNQHVSKAVFMQEASSALRLLEGQGWLSASPEPAPPAPPRQPLEEALRRAVGMINMAEPRARAPLENLAEARLAEFLSRPDDAFLAPVPEPERAAHVLACFAEALWSAGRRREAWEANAAARRRAPEAAESWVQEGLFAWEERDDARARRAFAEALRLDPGREDARFFLRKLGDA